MRRRRGEERGGCRGPPVHQQPLLRGIREAEASDVGDDALLVDHATDARVEAEPAKDAQPRRQALHLEIAFECALASVDGFVRSATSRVWVRSTSAASTPRSPRTVVRRGDERGSAFRRSRDGRSNTLS
jgi:hypothetical protein